MLFGWHASAVVDALGQWEPTRMLGLSFSSNSFSSNTFIMIERADGIVSGSSRIIFTFTFFVVFAFRVFLEASA
jgi:hypothetical protein